jgi:hypothetical protein
MDRTVDLDMSEIKKPTSKLNVPLSAKALGQRNSYLKEVSPPPKSARGSEISDTSVTIRQRKIKHYSFAYDTMREHESCVVGVELNTRLGWNIIW